MISSEKLRRYAVVATLFVLLFLLNITLIITDQRGSETDAQREPENVIATVQLVVDPHTGVISEGVDRSAHGRTIRNYFLHGSIWNPGSAFAVSPEFVVNDFLAKPSLQVERNYDDCFVGAIIIVKATWQNKANSPHLTGPFHDRLKIFALVGKLTDDHELKSADRPNQEGFKGVGAEQDLDVGPERVLTPGETFTGIFEIDLGGCDPFEFFVDIIGMPVVDLDIDSDNDNGFSNPSRIKTEDSIENDPSKRGKVLLVNDNDNDSDGIPDFADGFGAGGFPEASETSFEVFVPIVVELALSIDLDVAKVKIVYDAADPADIRLTRADDGTFSVDFDGQGPPQGPPGHLRIWTTSGSQPRSPQPYSKFGHYLAPETYDAYFLFPHFDEFERIDTWYLEGVTVSDLVGTPVIWVEVDPDGDGPAGFARDEVRVTIAKVELDPVTSNTSIAPDDHINEIKNPSGIVIESSPTPSNVATIELTVEPDALFADDDDRITWSIESQGGEATFFTPQGGQPDKTGKQVRIFGRKEGRILLKATVTPDKTNRLVEKTYEAVVLPLRNIFYRVNLLSGDTAGVGTTTTATQAADHVSIANIYLRQAGIRLVPLQFGDATDGAVAVPNMPGFFTAKVSDDLVKVTEYSRLEDSIRVNDEAAVVQITYIQEAPSVPAGQTINFPGNFKGTVLFPVKRFTITENYRITVSDEPKDHTMTLLGEQLRAGEPQTWGLVVTNANGDPGTRKQEYGETIAHEIGHMMGLGHRDHREYKGGTLDSVADDIFDGLDKPDDQNLMDVAIRSEDIDLIQTIAMRGSGIIFFFEEELF